MLDPIPVRLKALFRGSPRRVQVVEAMKWPPQNGVTTVDELEDTAANTQVDVDRRDLVRMMKKMGEEGFGRFIVGRHDHPTRIKWSPKLLEGDRARNVGDSIEHLYKLRPTHEPISIELPVDLTTEEARRLSSFILTLPFEQGGRGEDSATPRTEAPPPPLPANLGSVPL